MAKTLRETVLIVVNDAAKKSMKFLHPKADNDLKQLKTEMLRRFIHNFQALLLRVEHQTKNLTYEAYDGR